MAVAVDTGFAPAQGLSHRPFTGYTARCGGVGRLAVPARWGGGGLVFVVGCFAVLDHTLPVGQ